MTDQPQNPEIRRVIEFIIEEQIFALDMEHVLSIQRTDRMISHRAEAKQARREGPKDERTHKDPAGWIP